MLIKKLFYALLATALGGNIATAQIAITAADMPVAGDTLRWSAAVFNPGGGNSSNYTQTGNNYTWNFTGLKPATQGVDAYKTALSVSPLYFTISPTAYGYQVADSLPVPGLPINVKEAYTFFNKKNNPSRFIAEGFGAKISGIPIPASYTDADEIYFFPLTLGRTDTSTYKLDVNIAGLGRLVQNGSRITTVDGRGTIETPFTTAPVACLRVRTQVTGTDSLIAQGVSILLPRNTVDYQWLANGQHYPMLWVSATLGPNGQPTPTSVRYRDVARSTLKTTALQLAPQSLEVHVTAAGRVQLFLPVGWERNTVELFDVAGRRAITPVQNTATVDATALTAGIYLVRVTTVQGTGYAKIVR